MNCERIGGIWFCVAYPTLKVKPPNPRKEKKR